MVLRCYRSMSWIRKISPQIYADFVSQIGADNVGFNRDLREDPLNLRHISSNPALSEENGSGQ